MATLSVIPARCRARQPAPSPERPASPPAATPHRHGWRQSATPSRGSPACRRREPATQPRAWHRPNRRYAQKGCHRTRGGPHRTADTPPPDHPLPAATREQKLCVGAHSHARHRPTRQRHALHAVQLTVIDLPCEASSSRQGARDDVALYFAGSLTDFQNFRVRIEAGDARLQDVAVTTVNLQALARGPVGDL